MSSPSRRSAEVDSVFRRSLGAIHFALVSLYRLSEEDSAEAAENLYIWFGRFSERASSLEINVPSLRLPLLVATCRVGLTGQLCKLDGKPCTDEHLSKVLGRPPEDVAWDLETRLKAEERA